MVTLFLIVIYAAFISLGLPDSLLGVAWPVAQKEFGASLGDAGIISMVISVGTVVSSLFSSKLLKRLRRGKGNGGKRADDRSGSAGLQLCTRFCFYDSAGDPSGPRCRRGGLGPERIRGGAL